MRTPGFAAGASVYRTSKPYYMSAAANHTMSTQAMPQLPLNPREPIRRCQPCKQNASSPTGFSRTCCEGGECDTTPCTPPPPGGGGGGGAGGGGGGCSPLFPSGSGLPIYGNYCGPGHGDPTGATPAVDAVDAVCRAHDLCYGATNMFNCGCDRALIASMPAAIAATPCLTGKIAWRHWHLLRIGVCSMQTRSLHPLHLKGKNSA